MEREKQAARMKKLAAAAEAKRIATEKRLEA